MISHKHIIGLGWARLGWAGRRVEKGRRHTQYCNDEREASKSSRLDESSASLARHDHKEKNAEHLETPNAGLHLAVGLGVPPPPLPIQYARVFGCLSEIRGEFSACVRACMLKYYTHLDTRSYC